MDTAPAASNGSKADIWADYDDFSAKAATTAERAEALVAATAEGRGATEAFGALGSSCKSRQDSYRQKLGRPWSTIVTTDQRAVLIWDLPSTVALGVGHLSAGAGLLQMRIRVDADPLLFRLCRPSPRAVPLNLGCIWQLQSRYVSFVVSPKGLFRYLKNIGSNPSSTGHNPWGLGQRSDR